MRDIVAEAKRVSDYVEKIAAMERKAVVTINGQKYPLFLRERILATRSWEVRVTTYGPARLFFFYKNALRYFEQLVSQYGNRSLLEEAPSVPKTIGEWIRRCPP